MKTRTNQTTQTLIQFMTPIVIIMGLGASFWYSTAWLKLCYGLALFLFGMQCIEEGLQHAAGGTLQKLMSRCTATPFSSLTFGVFSTLILQSSTLMSLLTMAFLSTGMITLNAGLAIIYGTNLGATSGIWLLAIAGQSISLSPAAIPLLVFGMLLSWFNQTAKAIGRVLIGIALIFMGIDAIKNGFQAFGGQVDFAALKLDGISQIMVFSLIGFVLTFVLQSSHATLILTLAALAHGQINMAQGFALAIGSNLGSSASTALVGLLGSDRNGQRLALAHLLFNTITAILSWILWLPLTQLVHQIALWTHWTPLIQLALFHTLFNSLGVMVFWKPQNWFAQKLNSWLPENPNPNANQNILPPDHQALKPQFLNPHMLRANDTALHALQQEIQRFNQISLEIICHAIFVPSQTLWQPEHTPIPNPPQNPEPNVQTFYEWQIKPLYSEILAFCSKMDTSPTQNQYQMILFQMVEMVKESKHLQKNMQNYLNQNTPIGESYRQLRLQLFQTLFYFHHQDKQKLTQFIQQIEPLRQHALQQLRQHELDSWQVSSLMNDINYVRRISEGLSEINQINQITPTPN